MNPPPDQDTERQHGRRAGINLALRLLVGGVFVGAGGLKILDPAAFATAVDNYRLVPPVADNLVALTLPWIEVAAGIMVLAGIWLRAAAAVITVLTAVFLLAILSALARGLNIDCGCFGTVGGRHVGLTTLALDGTLFVLALCLVRRSRANPGKPILCPSGGG